MDVKAVFWLGFLCTFVIDTTVDSVIPPYLVRAKVRAPKIFKPTAQKCCKLGQRTAKKKMSCSDQLGQRDINRVFKKKWVSEQLEVKGRKKSQQKLMSKIAKCSINYARTFEKCCKFRENYYRDLRLCKVKHRRRKDRKKCKKLVRKKYT